VTAKTCAKLDTAAARQSTASLFEKREIAAAVVTEQCTKREHLTMYLRMCALFVMMQIFAAATFAVGEKRRPA